MILKEKLLSYALKTNTEMKPEMCEVQNFFTGVKHKPRSYFEYCLTTKDGKFTICTKSKRTPKIKRGHSPLNQLTHQLSGAQNKKKHIARRSSRVRFPLNS